MEETKIWAIEDTSATPLNTINQVEKERLLEDILTANPDMLEEGLQLVGRQTSTADGPLDLLGVDTEGRLVVFELKRGTLNRDAVAQVIDYASSLDAMDTENLIRHIKEQSGEHDGIEKIDDFMDWHNKLQESNESEGGLASLTPPRMVLVGLGVDDTTERMVQYMASSGMNISLLTFYGFVNTDGKTLLARNLEVDSASITDRRKASYRYDGRSIFNSLIQSQPSDMQNLMSNIVDMFRSHLAGDQSTYSSKRRNFNLDYSWSDAHKWDDGTIAKRRATLFIEVDERKGEINVGFHPVAVAFVPDEFSQLSGENIRLETGQAQALWGTQEYRFPLKSLEEWEERKDKLTALTQKVCEAYNAAREKAQSKSG